MDSASIQPGLQGTVSQAIGPEHTAQHLGSGNVQVMATPQMILLMERASMAAVDHLLPEGYCTVGFHLDVRHLAPTPVGFEVQAFAELLEVEGRMLTFRVQVHEQPFGEGSLVGKGTHQRAIINVASFGERVAEKAG
jgi:predicted thioesterase